MWNKRNARKEWNTRKKIVFPPIPPIPLVLDKKYSGN